MTTTLNGGPYDTLEVPGPADLIICADDTGDHLYEPGTGRYLGNADTPKETAA